MCIPILDLNTPFLVNTASPAKRYVRKTSMCARERPLACSSNSATSPGR